MSIPAIVTVILFVASIACGVYTVWQGPAWPSQLTYLGGIALAVAFAISFLVWAVTET